MEKYIALLRGINVSGQKKIKMADLRDLLAKNGMQQVQTYIQSGNILFEHPEKHPTELAAWITDIIRNAYDFEVPTIVLKPNDLEKAIAGNPFSKDPAKDPTRFYVTFLEQAPDPELVKQLKALDYSPEEVVVDEAVVYFYSPESYGRAKMNNNFLEKKLKVPATTRNWRSVHILLEMS
ncbi:MAG: DUF1697 domain-containing protein [Saprospiraceae bacterium]|nr:DUF1697 domain-containing protein [Saprospiraceae bacterium]